MVTPDRQELLDLVKATSPQCPDESVLALVRALERVAGKYEFQGEPIERAIHKSIAAGNVAWDVSDTYWHLLRGNSVLMPGVVFTPPELAEKVVSNLNPGSLVVDLGAGTGMLSIVAAKRGFDVLAIERNADLVHLLECLAALEGVADRIRAVTGDALTFAGDPSSQIMSNPPYTRHQSIDKDEKAKLVDLCRRLGLPLRGSAGHFAYFMAYAWQAEWSDREVFLVPTNWLETRYGEALLAFLAREKNVALSFPALQNGKSLFRRVLTTSCIVTTTEKSEDSASPKDDHSVELGRFDSRQRAIGIVSKLQSVVFQSNGRGEVASGLTLGDVLRIRRGIATGSNEFFVLRQSQAEEAQLRGEELARIVRYLKKYDDPEADCFLWVPGETPGSAALKKIEYGEELRVNLRTLCAERNPWWRIKLRKPPPYLFSYMGRRKPYIVANSRNVLHLNNIHGVYPIDGASKCVVERIVQWLETPAGQSAVLAHARHYQGGLWKLEPGDVHRVEVPMDVLLGIPRSELENVSYLNETLKRRKSTLVST